MGCTSSEVQLHTSYLNRKPELWFILGGPGSNKGKVIQYLVRDYKYLYLSVFEILQFQKQRNTPDSELIKKSILEKKDFSCQLITRLLKKAIASLGPRRYLIDGYPRNQSDVEEFQKQPFLKQVTLQKLIHIQVSQQKMKQTGLNAKKSDKRPQQEVEKQVQQVIDEYRNHEEKITQLYRAKNSLISIPQRDTQDETYNQLRLQFQSLSKFRSINEGDARVFFVSFDIDSHQFKYTYEISKAYGFYHYDFTQLIDECKLKNNNQSKYLKECENKKQLPSSEFVIQLFRKQFQKKDFIGNFLITGFPRNINDAQLWDKTFGWEVVVDTYLSFDVSDEKIKASLQKNSEEKSTLKPETINSFQKYTKNKKVLINFYQKHSKTSRIDCQNKNSQQILKQVQSLMSQKGITKRKSSFTHKLIFMPTISEQSSLKIELNHFKEINMMYCYQNQAKQTGLYSELIQSYLSSGSPLPGFLAVRILIKNLSFLVSSQAPKHNQLTILVKSFPNSVQQMVSWNEQIGDTYPLHSVVYFDASEQKIKKILEKHKVDFKQETVDKIQRNGLQLEDFIEKHEIKSHKLANEQKIQQFLTQLA